MLGIIITGTNALVENCDRSQLFDYSQLNYYLCACFKLLKKQIDAGQSLISMEKIKSERVFMLMKMVKWSNLKYDKSIYKKKITSVVTPYKLVGYIQLI